jgi:ribonuclease HI
VIVRDETGHIRYWWQQRAGSMTCNEAEYAAVIFAFEQLLKLDSRQRPSSIEIYCDSRVVVDQMSGLASAHAPGLRQAQARLKTLVIQFEQVTFHHVSREYNRLADALAFEAVENAPHQKARQEKEKQENGIWEELISTWRS